MDDDEISLHLADANPAYQEAGLRAAIERFKHPLLLFLKSKGLSNHHDLEEILSDTFIAIHRCAQSGKLDLETSPKNLIFTIAKNKWIDRIRRQSLQAANDDKYLQEVSNALLDSGASQQWYDLRMRSKTREIFDDFLKEIPHLPARQAQVVNALALLFGAKSAINVTNLRDVIQQMAGETPPLPSIKSAWDAVRQKLRDRIEQDL